jgi:hypothetical protein
MPGEPVSMELPEADGAGVVTGDAAYLHNSAPATLDRAGGDHGERDLLVGCCRGDIGGVPIARRVVEPRCREEHCSDHDCGRDHEPSSVG